MSEKDKLDRIYKILLGVHKSIGVEQLRDSLLEAIGLVEEIRMEKEKLTWWSKKANMEGDFQIRSWQILCNLV